MERLNLPVFSKKADKKRRLTMDEYLRFVLDNLKYTKNAAVAKRLKKNTFIVKRFIVIDRLEK